MPSPWRRDTLRPRTFTSSSSARTRVWRSARSTRRSRYSKRSSSSALSTGLNPQLATTSTWNRTWTSGASVAARSPRSPVSHSATWKSASATILLTGSPARRWSSRACAPPAPTASQHLSMSPCWGLYPETGKSYPFDQSGVTGNTGEAIMSEDPRDKAAALAEGMEAAGALIENLEQEVADLRSDLDRAAAALKAAQEEVSSRAGALEEKERVRVEAESEVEHLKTEISDLKQRHSDEQLRLSNEHINELAEVRSRLEEQRRTDVDAASSETRLDTIKEEGRREREALEARYREEIEALKNALEHSVREDFEKRLAEERSAAHDRQTAAVQALRSAAAERELELQNVVGTQQGEIESLRDELEAARRSSEEQRKEELRQFKALAEGRENDLRKTHATRLAEAKESADKRVAAIQAQREADNRALRARHEEQLAAEDERRKAETWALDERLREAAVQRETEMRAYTTRIKELEAVRLSQKSSSQGDLERVVDRFGAEISDFENRITELEGALEESEARRNELETVLGELR